MFLDLIIPIIAFCTGIIGLISLKRGPIFLPTKKNDVELMMNLLQVESGDVSVDLGSGDGRMVIALAKAGAVAHGYEHNPFLVWWSRYKIYRAGLSGRAFIHRENFWNADFSKFTVLTVFGIGYIMKPLGKKFVERENPGFDSVASYTFQFSDWKTKKRESGIYIYEL